MHRVAFVLVIAVATLSACYGLAMLAKAALIDWAWKREREQRRLETINSLLAGQPEHVIDWVAYGDKGRPRGLLHAISLLVERRVRTWKEWEEWKLQQERGWHEDTGAF